MKFTEKFDAERQNNISDEKTFTVGEECGLNMDDENDCDACPFCNDTCGNLMCRTCSAKRTSDGRDDGTPPRCSLNYGKQSKDRRYTICQVRRHNSKKSAWLVADGNVYDATEYIKWHPGGERSILRYSGGIKDCKEDLEFHSKNAQHLWKKFQIGVLSHCHGTELCQSLYLEAQRHNEGCSIC